MVVVAVAAAGAGGWALRDASITPSASPTAPVSTSPSQPAGGLSPEQAKARTCGAYKVLGLQWSVAFRKWLDALPQPWSRNDPKVTAVTADFDTKQTQVAAQLAQLTDPNAPLTSSTRFAMCGSRSLTSPPARRDCDAGRNQRQNRPSQCCNVHRQQGVRPDLDSPDSAATAIPGQRQRRDCASDGTAWYYRLTAAIIQNGEGGACDN